MCMLAHTARAGNATGTWHGTVVRKGAKREFADWDSGAGRAAEPVGDDIG